MARKIILGLVVLFCLIQFFRIDKTNPPINQAQDIINATNAPVEITSILKTSCYDCHSNETKYPWYTNIAPVSWLIAKHRNEGRKHLNFSIWTTYDTEKKIKKLQESDEVIGNGEMPMSVYILQHSDAKLTPESKKTLLNWFKKEKVSLQ